MRADGTPLDDESAALARSYQAIIERQPETMQAAVAADNITQIMGRRLFPAPRYSCSAAATASYDEAERQFQANAFEAAKPDYERAVAGCPDNAEWWVCYGDAFFQNGQLGRAKELYRHALQLDRWNRAAYRFLADAEGQDGDNTQAYRSATMAVVSDPTYEAGWFMLMLIDQKLGGTWNRPDSHKPQVGMKDGKPEVLLDRRYDSRASLTAWMSYGLAKLTMMKTRDASDPADPKSNLPSAEEWSRMSAIERERTLVGTALEIYEHFVADHPEGHSVFWDGMRKAVDAGFMDEAIYLNLMDADLAPSYLFYRADHTQRLVEYVTKFIAPVPDHSKRAV